jgi:hypothetical protein
VNKPFSNQMGVINVLKPNEDPMGLAAKRILTKENIELLEKIKYTAERLGVLDSVSSDTILKLMFRTTRLIVIYASSSLKCLETFKSTRGSLI